MDQLSRLGTSLAATGVTPPSFPLKGETGGIGGSAAFMPGAAMPRLGGLDMAGASPLGMGATNPMMASLQAEQQMMTMMQMLLKLMMNGSQAGAQSGVDPLTGLGGETSGSSGTGGYGGGDSSGGGGDASVGSSSGGGSSYDGPWCAAFAINMMKDHGVLDTSGLSNPNYCPTIKGWAQGKQNWGENGKYTPKPGDAILFDFEGYGTSDHIGIVESVKDGKVYTIEGNSSDSVKRNSYNLGDSKIDGYVVSKDSTQGQDKPGEAKSEKPAAPPAPAPKETAPKVASVTKK